MLPLFLGLGWSHQQIAVEWNRVDMAIFKSTPTTDESCVVVVEAKGLGRGLGRVVEQALGYVRSLKLDAVTHVVTTDGPNVLVYEKRRSGDWSPDPVGYINVSRLQREYVIPRGANVVKTLVKLQPNFG